MTVRRPTAGTPGGVTVDLLAATPPPTGPATPIGQRSTPRRLPLLVTHGEGDARELMQSRLRLLAMMMTGLLAATLTFQIVMDTVYNGPEHVAFSRTWMYTLHGCITAGFLFTIGYLTWVQPSEQRLTAVDGSITVKTGLFASLLMLTFDLHFRPDVAMQLGMAQFLYVRASLVPSTAKRTAWLGAASLLPVVAAAVALSLLAGDPMLPPIPILAISLLWTGFTIGGTTVTSHVIYGLRRDVEAAEQLGQYTLVERIGQGGMGTVYRARHALLRRPTAIKLLDPALAGTQAVARFEREVQVTSQLTHPNTVAIYDFGRTPDGGFYYAMEYLDGLDLEELVAASGPQPAARVVHLLRQVCGALAEAHAAGVIHRDVKPANIMVCDRAGARDVVKILDFGLVKYTSASDPALSGEALVRGTPLYMAPEAVHSPEDVDNRADVYGVGAVGYFLLTGAPVFAGGSPIEIMAMHLRDRPLPPSSKLESIGRPAVPAPLEALVMACLEKDRDARPASAEALASALAGLRDIPAWGDPEACAWWRAHGAATRARRPAASSAALGPLTIDLSTRTTAASPPPSAALKARNA